MMCLKDYYLPTVRCLAPAYSTFLDILVSVLRLNVVLFTQLATASLVCLKIRFSLCYSDSVKSVNGYPV